jgi:rare lipoprotein A (peptidoglycan hydrolase)
MSVNRQVTSSNIYIVKQGDTLNSIVRAAGIAQKDIFALTLKVARDNSLKNPNQLQEGARLNLSALKKYSTYKAPSAVTQTSNPQTQNSRASSSKNASTITSSTKSVRVRAGDSLSAIASRYGVGVNALARANGIRDINIIRENAILNLPSAIEQSSTANNFDRNSKNKSISSRFVQPKGSYTYKDKNGKKHVYYFRPVPVSNSKIVEGILSWYGSPKYTKESTTASGAFYNPEAKTIAHPYLKFGTKVRLTNMKNGKTVIATVNDRGPYEGPYRDRGKYRRIADASERTIDLLTNGRRGSVIVRMEILG